ncbi:MAG TPA: HAD hydrolase-like protein [Leptolyngbyaceae cyanobacterium]
MATFLFDFDGTIADTLEAIVKIGNRLAPEFGLKPATKEELKAFKDFSAEQLLQQHDLSLFKLIRLLRRLRQELQTEIPHLALHVGMAEALRDLHQQGHTLGIVTSNSAENVYLFLRVHNLTPCFRFVQTGASLLGKSRVLKQMLRRQRLKATEVIYVGDETRDVDASRKVGIRVAAVTWGFNSRFALERHRPDFLIDVPQTLIEIASRV